MSRWNDEYERRLRRVIGVTDDSVEVSVDTEFDRSWSGGCDTCGWYDETVTITVSAGHGRDRKSRTFSELGELIRALDEVEDREENAE